MSKTAVRNGIDRMEEYDGLFRGKRLGLVTGPTGVTKALTSSAETLARRHRLTALYAPEHGLWGSAQAGEAVGAGVDPRTGVPVYSLYGSQDHSRQLTEDMVADVDMLVFDMQTVGARYFTYLYTLAYVMQGAQQFGLPMVVLDRVNPLDGVTVGGNVLDERFASFVGQYAIPARYGMTIGEFARWLQAERGIGCGLTVVPCEGWRRRMYFDDTDLPWVPPSPNLPTLDAALCYVGTCLIEGTNLSEGRGTTKPFEAIGAPWVDPLRLADALRELALPGVLFRPTRFVPTFSKHAGALCGGVQLHIADRAAFDPYLTGLRLIEVLRRDREFAFLQPAPGEYFIDRLLGSDALRRPDFAADGFLLAGRAELEHFRSQRQASLLYDE